MACDIPSRLTPSSLSIISRKEYISKFFSPFFQCGDVENTKVSRHFKHTLSPLLCDAVIISHSFKINCGICHQIVTFDIFIISCWLITVINFPFLVYSHLLLFLMLFYIIGTQEQNLAKLIF